MPYTTEDFKTAAGRKPWDPESAIEQATALEGPDLLEWLTVLDVPRMLALNLIPGDLVLTDAEQGISGNQQEAILRYAGVPVFVTAYLVLENAFGFLVGPGWGNSAIAVLRDHGIAAR